MINLTIDGRAVSVPKGTTILEAARSVGIRIPTLCWLKKLSPIGSCRMCVVEVDGLRKPVTACDTPAGEGLVIRTDSPQLREMRRCILAANIISTTLSISTGSNRHCPRSRVPRVLSRRPPRRGANGPRP